MTTDASEPHPADPSYDDQIESPADAAKEFRAGAQHLFAASANVLGTTSVDGDVVAGNKVVHLHTGLARLLISGRVPANYLDSLLSRFARHDGYERLVERLRIDRIVILRGPRSSGRRLAALSLLTDVLGRTAPLVVLDPATTPSRLVDQLQSSTGHVVADLLLSAEAPLHQQHLFAARQFLEHNGSYLVITVDHQEVLDHAIDELHDWQAPPPLKMLKTHLAADIPPATYDPFLQLAETSAFLKTGPSPVEIAGFAQLALAYLDGQVQVDELAAYGVGAARQLAQQIFTGDRCLLRDKAFTIALAVFDQSPYPLVAEAGDALYQAFQEQEEPDRPAAISVFGTERRARLEMAHADEFDAPPGEYPPRRAGFRYRSTWVIVLRHVWSEHPAARVPMISWLLELADDTRTLHRIRAAVAVGCLAAEDFDSVRRQLLTPWATSRRLRTRHLAAWALSTAVDQGAEPQVRQLLRYWAEGSAAKRWTVVRTVSVLANLLGRSSLALLTTIARNPAQDDRLNQELVTTLTDLATGPLSRQTLAMLAAWSKAGGQLRSLAHQAFLQAATRGERFSPAVLSRLVAADPLSGPSYVGMWRSAIDDMATRKHAGKQLAQLVVLAAGDNDLEAQLTRLCRALATSANDHARLDHLLRHLPAGAPDLAKEAAERIRRHLSPPSIEHPGATHAQL